MRHRNASVIFPRFAVGVLPAVICTAVAGAPALAQAPGETTVLRAARVLYVRGAVL